MRIVGLAVKAAMKGAGELMVRHCLSRMKAGTVNLHPSYDH